MEATNLYLRHSNSGKNIIGSGTLRTILLFGLLWMGTSANAQTSIFNYSGSIASYTVPAGVTKLNITASGAQGGNQTSAPASGGLGAIMSGNFTVTPGHVLNILVGQQPSSANHTGGGGGGSFVWDVTAGNVLLIAAGGGGGAGYQEASNTGINAVTTINGTNGGGGVAFGGGGTAGNGGTVPAGTCNGTYGAGGAGWLSNGANGNGGGCSIAGGGIIPLSGGSGGAYGGSSFDNGPGGFGGGGGSQGQCSWSGGGGGGGYSGGGGGNYTCSGSTGANPGGGGGSYNIGTAQANSVGNSGNGVVTICAYPAPGTITGTTGNICPGVSYPLADVGGVAGGTWSSSDGTKATVGASSGILTGVAVGTATITYTTPANACGTSTAVVTVTVNALPSPITGTEIVCAGGSTTNLFDATPGGTWSSSNGNATVGTGSGIVTGVTAGNSNINYTLPTGCFVTATVTINPLPAISGGSNVTICYGSPTPLTASGGWNYSWAPSAGLSATTGATVTANPSGTTTYTVTGYPVISYNQAFAGGVIPTTQCSAWNTFRAALNSSYSYTGFTIKGSLNTTGYTCTNPAVATAIATALRNGTATTLSSDGHTWYVGTGCGGGCGGGGGQIIELAVDQGTCSCGSVAAVRPAINNTNWGGMGTTCSALSQTLEVDFYTISCSNTATVMVSVNPLPTISTTVGTGTAICNGSSTTLTATGGATYTWDPATGLSATTGTNVMANPTSNTSYLITGTDVNGCVNTTSVTVTVNPLPAPITGPLNFCLISSVLLSDDTTGGTWSSSNTSIATVDASGIVTGVTTGVDTIIYTLPTSCSTYVSGTVNPLSDVAFVPDQNWCNGSSTTPVHFTGTVVPGGTTYYWVNSIPDIGSIGGSGTDSIGSFTIVDTPFSPYSPDTATITVTPYNNGCPGTPGSFHYNINPTPDIITPVSGGNQIKCNGDSTDNIYFTGDVAGTIFTWTNSNAGIGLDSSGTNNIGRFVGINTSTAPITATINVTPSTAAGCTGGSNSFTIVINPTPSLSTPLTATICDSTLFNYPPASLTSDSSFTWRRNSIAGIRNPADSGINNPNEWLVDTTVLAVVDTYVYVVTGIGGCTRTQNVIVTVNPVPTLSTTHFPGAKCDSTLFHYVDSSFTPGVTYAWSRAFIPGISNPTTASGTTDTMNEYLVNSMTYPIPVHYAVTLTVGPSCSYTEDVTVTINPKPTISNLDSLPARLCDSSLLYFIPRSATTGTTTTWSRIAIVGNPARNSLVDTINEMLVNNTTASVIVIYVDTLVANTCRNIENFGIRVMPTPVLTSTVDTAICDSVTFNYTPTSATAGTTFAWVRPYVLGIDRAAGSGPGNPNEQLINTTNDNLNVIYNYTLGDSGCTHPEQVLVVVHPTPVLSSNLTPSVCSGTSFLYWPTSYTFGTSFSWKRGKLAGIAPATDSGSGLTISETLVDSLLTPITTGYDIALKANGCIHHQILHVRVDPAPPVEQITTYLADQAPCSNTLFQNFGTSSVPPAGQTFTWSVQNAEIYAEGSGHQYILVDFKNPGQAVVTLNSHLSGFSCVTSSSMTYNVGSSVSELPQIVYFNGQFICLQDDRDNYQWGYDDAVTLDSTILQGEINPNYFNSAPDLTYKYYWVITNHNGCMQKSYYNVPSGITNINTASLGDMKVYPNPANDVLNVEINTSATGKFELEVVNLLGQKLMNSGVTDKKASLNVASLPAGTYLVVCYRDGIKMAAVRFVKN